MSAEAMPVSGSSPRDAWAALSGGGAALIDVREPWEYEEQHIPGAILIPLAEVPQRMGEIPSDRDVYVHCRLGGRSSNAVQFLRHAGRPRAINVEGGIEAWAEAGLPVE